MYARMLKAIADNNTDLLRSLLSQTSDVNLQDRNGYDLLQSAVFYRRLGAVNALLEHHVPLILCKGKLDARPIEVAVANETWDIVQSLIQHAAKRRIASLRLKTEQDSFAVKKQLESACDLLMAGAPLIWICQDEGLQLLDLSIQYGESEITHFLFDYGLDPLRKNKDGKTLIELAAYKGAWGVLDHIFISNPVEACRSKRAQSQALRMAIQWSQYGLAEGLLEIGAPLAADEDAVHPDVMRAALYFNDGAMVALLIKYGAIWDEALLEEARQKGAWDFVLELGGPSFLNLNLEDKEKASYAEALFNRFQKSNFLTGVVDERLKKSIDGLISNTLSRAKDFQRPSENNSLLDYQALCFQIGSAIFRQPDELFQNVYERYRTSLTFLILADDYPKAKTLKFYCYLALMGKLGLYPSDELSRPLKEIFSKECVAASLFTSHLLEHLQRLFFEGNVFIDNELGEIYGVIEDYEKSYAYSLRAAVLGSQASMVRLAGMLDDEERSFFSIPSIKAELMYYAGMCKHKGLASVRDDVKALQLLFNAAERGHHQALLYLEAELKRGLGDLSAQRALARFYLDKKDYQAAARWAFNENDSTLWDADTEELIQIDEVRKNTMTSRLVSLIQHHPQRFSSGLYRQMAQEVKNPALFFRSLFAGSKILDYIDFDVILQLFASAKFHLSPKDSAECLIYCAKRSPCHRWVSDREVDPDVSQLKATGCQGLANQLSITYAIVKLLNGAPITKAIIKSLSLVKRSELNAILSDFPLEYEYADAMERVNNAITYYVRLHEISFFNYEPNELAIKIKDMQNGGQIYALVDQATVKDKYERKGEVRKKVFDSLMQLVELAKTGEEKLSILEGAKNNPVFSRHRSIFFKPGRTASVKKIDKKIEEIKKNMYK